MTSILISIRPEWCAKILNGEKTIEIRKTAPKDWANYLLGKTKKKPEPMTGYFYCTKGKKRLVLDEDYNLSFDEHYAYGDIDLNGKVVAKFTLREVERINCETYSSDDSYLFRHEYFPEKSTEDEILRKSCISGLEPYLDGCEGYAWHISDLVIFDKPKDLSEFEYLNPSGVVTVSQRSLRGLSKRPPQSWLYVEVRK